MRLPMAIQKMKMENLIIKEDEAAVVRRIFREYLNGKGSICNSKGIDKRQYTPVRSAEKWNGQCGERDFTKSNIRR